MAVLRLRPHHIVCIQFFEGRGYNEVFTANLYHIIGMIENDASLRIHVAPGSDDVCKACPHDVDGTCAFERSVVGKDASVIRFLGLPDEVDEPVDELMALVKERIRDLKDVQEICGECEWSSICNSHLLSMHQ
jgi:uncharacterized protein